MEPSLLGVLGFPVSHSISPEIHGAALDEAGLKLCYLPLAVPPERLKQALAGLRGLPFRGVNVTIPHKQTVIENLDWLEPKAALLGAVNTIRVKENGALEGFNTDYPALCTVLRRDRIAGRTVLVLGAGGAALATAFAAKDLEASRIIICARRAQQAIRVAERVGAQTMPWQARHDVAADVLLQTTPVGMRGVAEASLPLKRLPHGVSFVYDLVYNPAATVLLQLARQRAIEAESGLSMLVEQAALSFEVWFDQPAPRAAMAKAATAWLGTKGMRR